MGLSKAGRNDPCPCGSGKKYKKCCLAKDQEAASKAAAALAPPFPSGASPGPASFLARQHPNAAGSTAPARAEEPPAPPRPLDPIAERADIRWREFESEDGGGRIALFLETLDDAEVMTDDMAFGMLDVLRGDALKSGDRTRFAECLGALRERRPEVFAGSAHYYLYWGLLDALAEGRQEDVPSLARELAEHAGRDIDTFNRAADVLGYHGQLSVLVEALRIAWPLVNSSDNVVPWGVTEFAEKGANHEIFDYVEHTAAPDPADPILLDRVRFFIGEPDECSVRQFAGDLMGKSGQEWQAGDFAMKPRRKRRRDEWDDEPEQRPAPDQGASNLSRLMSEFVGYLRREEGVPFPRGDLVRQELFRYFARRIEGDLDPRPSMLEQALHPHRELPKPPRPAHPLCPERVTLDVHLAGLMGMMSERYHSAAALFQAIPAWLRFLESRRLIDAATSQKVVAELLPLHATLLRVWEQYTEDPQLYRQGQAWRALP